MSSRRGFLKMLSMAAVATALPLPNIQPEKLTIPLTTGDSDMRIGVYGVERMRITSSGNVCLGTTIPNTKLKLYA
jgi:hypothetical protein